MAQSSSRATPVERRRSDTPDFAPADHRSAGYGPEDFPGCESFHLPASELESYEGRLEFWDGRTETAWKVREPTSTYHEVPSQELAQMAARFASLRGSRIKCLGSSDLLRFDAAGRKRWLMQADQVLYLNPERVPPGPAIHVDEDPLPDIVLEVDHTTDVRRRKLGIYQESGFPEVWVLVPRESSLRAPGLTIHVHRDDAYREEAESRAFPGWKAEEVYRALTEDPLSAGAMRALERVALTMGEREGTKPEDDPFTRSLSLKAEARGDAKGYENGYENGYLRGREHGRKEALAENVVALLEARGIVATLDSEEDRALFDALSAEALMAAALACSGAADFRRRLRKAAR